ncbi:uncharacterized protein LOC128393857 [Panonychus citri]|uniref:uncharacterized protein LOC128393857 n=1 Tax=Panonychus citri TaxID=50023 RepID=UPI0023071086|nr:uncharacterized protein LOC128393857 [Panonychus citri]
MFLLNKLIDSKKKASKPEANIIVVNNEPTTSNSTPSSSTIKFNLPFAPLIPDNILISGLPQLDPVPLGKFGLHLQDFLRKKADTVSKNQIKLCEKIKEVESSTITITNHMEAKSKRLRKVEESFDRVQEMFDKCESSLESCLNSIDRLNNSLPPHLKLNNFDYNTKKLEPIES